MIRRATLLLALISAGCTMVGAPDPSPVPPPPQTDADPPRRVSLREVTLQPTRAFDEVRALWVVRFTMTSEEAVRDMIDRAEAAGINTLVVQVRGRADAFYASRIEPRAEAMRAPPDFDPLAYVVEEGHRRGMAVHAWVNTHLVWGPTDLPRSPAHLVNANPHWLAVPRALAEELAPVDPADPRYVDALVRYAQDRPETVEGVYSSPSHPAVQDLVHSVWMDLVDRYDLDGMHFDYIRFPSPEYDYSLGALERFRLWVRPLIAEDRFDQLDGRARRDLLAFVNALPAEWAQFRREHVTRLVRRLYADVKARKPEMTVSAAVIADADVAYQNRFQDWPSWLNEGILDIAVPMAYTPDSDRFRELVRGAREAAGSRERVWAGIGAYMNTVSSTIDMIDVARGEDSGGVVLFSYDWAVTDGIGDPDDPFLQRVGRARFQGR